MEVEKELSRVNQSETYNNQRLQSESIVDQLDIDVELGNACMERGDESDSSRKNDDWKN